MMEWRPRMTIFLWTTRKGQWRPSTRIQNGVSKYFSSNLRKRYIAITSLGGESMSWWVCILRNDHNHVISWNFINSLQMGRHTASWMGLRTSLWSVSRKPWPSSNPFILWTSESGVFRLPTVGLQNSRKGIGSLLAKSKNLSSNQQSVILLWFPKMPRISGRSNLCFNPMSPNTFSTQTSADSRTSLCRIELWRGKVNEERCRLHSHQRTKQLIPIRFNMWSSMMGPFMTSFSYVSRYV